MEYSLTLTQNNVPSQVPLSYSSKEGAVLLFSHQIRHIKLCMKIHSESQKSQTQRLLVTGSSKLWTDRPVNALVQFLWVGDIQESCISLSEGQGHRGKACDGFSFKSTPIQSVVNILLYNSPVLTKVTQTHDRKTSVHAHNRIHKKS